jgi:glutaredoxin
MKGGISMYLWKIIIRSSGNKKILRFMGKSEHTNMQVYEKAKAYAKELRAADTTGRQSIELVSGTKAYGPKKDTVVPKNHLWCPFCVKARIFLEDNSLGVKRCIVCGISDSDFYVKKYNHEFAKEYQEYLLSIKFKKEDK